MARTLSRALAQIPTSRVPLPRRFSTRPNIPGSLIAIDAESEAAVERAAINSLEDIVHRILVKRAQPAWLPLRPGFSYWVPPRSSVQGLAQVIGKFTTSLPAKDSAMLVASHRPWPSSDFLKGEAQSRDEAETDFELTVQSGDEEG